MGVEKYELIIELVFINISNDIDHVYNCGLMLINVIRGCIIFDKK